MSLARSLLLRLASLGLMLGLSAGLAHAGPPFQMPSISTSPGVYPLPDSASTQQSIWLEQGCNINPAACDFQATPEQLGYIHQGTTPPASPYQNQLWWNTSQSPAVLEAYQGSAWGAISGRIKLAADGNLYVAPSGVDVNNNCTNSIAPCNTIQYAVNVAQSTYDVNGHLLKINVANGSYSAGAVIYGPMVGQGTVGTATSTYPSGLQIIGNVGNPSAVTIADTVSFHTAVVDAEAGAQVNVQGITLSSVNGFGFFSEVGSALSYSNVIFGHAGVAHVGAYRGGIVQAFGNYAINGSAPAHLNVEGGGLFLATTPSTTITLSGTPAFSTGFAYLRGGYALINSSFVTFSGAATGPQFNLISNSTLDTYSFGQTTTFLPGDADSGFIGAGSFYLPDINVQSISSVTGLGLGGTANLISGFMGEGHGAVQLTTGTSGVGSSGSLQLNYATNYPRVCALQIDSFNGVWNLQATAQSGANTDAGNFVILWSNNGVNLTTNTSYIIDWICPGRSS